jgi:hypothetical protein
VRNLQLALCTVVGLAGCPKASPAPAAPATDVTEPTVPASVTQETDGEPWPIASTEFLELIPADTPYVFAQSEPIPAEVVRRVQPLLAPLVAAADEGLADATKKAKPEEARVLQELFGGTPTIAGLEKIGIDLNPRFVVYGLGVAPVFRVRLRDAAALSSALDRLEALSDKPSKTAAFHGQRYRYSESADGSLTVFAILGPDFVVAGLPPGAEIQRELLPLAFGQKLPATAMATSNTLAQVKTEHGLGPHLGGYVDIQAIWSAMVGQGSGLHRRVAAAFPSFAKPRSPECIVDGMRLAQLFPRLVFGYDELSGKRIVASSVLEMPPEITRHTKPIPGPIPGLAAKPGAGTLATLGVGIDMRAVEAAAKAYAAAVREHPFRCAEFTGFNELAETVATAPAVVPKPLFGLTGLGVQLDDVVDPGAEAPRLDGVVVVGIDDPKGALDALAKLVPNVALDKLRKPRTPVQLMSLMPAGGGSAPATISESWIAYGKRSIGMSFGKAGKRDLLRALDRQRKGEHALAVWSVDLGTWVERNPERLGELQKLDSGNARKLAQELLTLLGRAAFSLRLTERGVETEVAIDLPKR